MYSRSFELISILCSKPIFFSKNSKSISKNLSYSSLGVLLGITSLKIMTELFYSGPLNSQTTILTRIKQSIWDRKIDKMIDQFNRSIKYRGA